MTQLDWLVLVASVVGTVALCFLLMLVTADDDDDFSGLVG